MKNWYGWFIEQSFDDQSVFEEYKTVKMKSEGENWKEHVIEIPEEKIDEMMTWLENHLKPDWYAHLVKGNDLIVVFKNKSFKLTPDGSFDEVAQYGRTLGILEDQLPDVSLFALARESGF